MKLVVCSICEIDILKHVLLNWVRKREAFSTEGLFPGIALFAGGISYVFNFSPIFSKKKKGIYSPEKLNWSTVIVFQSSASVDSLPISKQ